MERKNAWKEYSKKELKELETVNAEYRHFLTVGKTERECVKEICKQAEAAGYVSIDTIAKEDRKLKKGAGMVEAKVHRELHYGVE